MMVPRMDSVAALYALQNSMMLTPCGPRAVPTGGAGVAAPAFKAILTSAATFFFFLGGIRFLDPSCGRLGEAQTFWICGKVRSTGVSRPKISTSALSRWLLTLISVIVA